MADELAVRRAANSLAAWLLTDSLLIVDPRDLQRTLELDASIAGRVLTEAECEEFVCGFEDTGDTTRLAKDFPATHEFLDSLF